MFSFSKKEEYVSLLVDIGNGNVSASLVVFSITKKPFIFCTTQSPISIALEPHADALLSSMIATVDAVVGEVLSFGFTHTYWKGKEKKIHDALLSFSSPWFLSQSKRIHIAEEKAFVITERFLHDIMEKERDLFEKEVSPQGAKGVSSASVVTLEQAVTNTKINGYPLDNSIGKKTKLFDISLYTSCTPNQVVDGVFQVLSKHTHLSHDKVYAHTFPFITHSVLGIIYPTLSDYMIMDVTGEVTDITLVRDNSIAKTVSFPSGRNLMIRQIGTTCGVSPEIAESILHIYTSGRGDESVARQMEEVCNNVGREWDVYFNEALTGLSEKADLPPRVFITADKDMSQFSINFLNLMKRDSTDTFKKNVDPVYIDESVFKTLCTRDSRLPENEFISLLSVFYDVFLKKDNK